MKNYVEGLGIYVGEFNESEIRAGKDRVVIEAAKKRHSLEYIKMKSVKDKKGNVVAMKFWVCKHEDMS